MTVASKSFVDVLFILLCGTIVLLSQSLRIGTIEAAPARVGGGGISQLSTDKVRPVVVTEDRLILDDTPCAKVEQITAQIQPDEGVVLIGGAADLTHHRMMRVWSELTERGVIVKLGVQPDDPGDNGQKTEH